MKSSLFYSLFPTPEFLRMPSVGLDVSDKSVRFLGFTYDGKKLKISQHADKKIESGIVESGKIKDEAKMKEVLASLKKEYNLQFVRVALPEEQAYLFKMTVPLVKKTELRESILLQLEEYVPIKAADSVFDYEIIKEGADSYDLQVSVIPTSVAESYVSIFTESGLMPISFEIEAQAIARAMIKGGDMGTYMIIDFGQSRTGISIVSGGAVAFTSTVDIGGFLITQSIAKELSLTTKEAEDIKRKNGLIKDKDASTGKEGKEVFSVILNVIATLRDEINKHYIYWHTHKESEGTSVRKIEKIILCGGDSNLPGLPDYLARSMRVNVELGNVWVNVYGEDGGVPEISFKDSLTYATAVGLALADKK